MSVQMDERPWPAARHRHQPEIFEDTSQDELSYRLETLKSLRDRATSLPTSSERTPFRISNANLQKRIATAVLPDLKEGVQKEVLKLSSAGLEELTLDTESLPIRASTSSPENLSPSTLVVAAEKARLLNGQSDIVPLQEESEARKPSASDEDQENSSSNNVPSDTPTPDSAMPVITTTRPKLSSRSVTTPVERRYSVSDGRRMRPSGLNVETSRAETAKGARVLSGSRNITLAESTSSSANIPTPPFSMPTYLQLELSSNRPSPLYIHRSASYETPYEPTHVKYERLLNFILLPPQLEQILWFGTFACLDAWLYAFTILPLRFFKAIGLFVEWIVRSLLREAADLSRFIYKGAGRIWNRRRYRKQPLVMPALVLDAESTRPSTGVRIASNVTLENILDSVNTSDNDPLRIRPLRRRQSSSLRYRKIRTEKPSRFQAGHKADILQGLLIIFSCMILMRFDASRMYHSIRGQAAIKLYVIYNVLEVFDRLFSALGQDILECLFSPETLNRNSKGQVQLMRPLLLFLSALLYCIIHSTALFYQVITLNVAVNSYSNALLTLLMSNQFVEIKGTVFKKIEKENLFQLTCADIVERFQLWLMLLIIALRNIVEVGGLSISLTDLTAPFNSANFANSTIKTFGMLPKSFTILPSLLPYQILGPFLLVLGSEAIVDWLKHAYITKFNATSPKVYGRFFDVLAKDYYSNAFSEQNLMRRLGLPVIPLTCLFIRATLQTYHMFLATNISFTPIITYATTVSLEPSPSVSSPVLARLDQVVRQALGRSSFGGGSSLYNWIWTVDDAIAFATMVTFFLVVYLLLLAFKLALGMVLLGIARRRYKGMRAREQEKVVETGSRRVGGWGAVEVGDDRRKIIYADDPDGLKAMRERESKGKKKEDEGKAKGNKDFDGVERYRMVAKRIW